MEIAKKIIFVTGGARSGKSRFAQKLAQTFPGPKAYLATAQALDEEMGRRIHGHRKKRPQNWQTLEEPVELVKVLRKNGHRFHLILLDCLTLWISNLMMLNWTDRKILQEAGRLLKVSREARCSLIMVGNEVGLGIVPDNPLARRFRDVNGWVQQRVTRMADEVYFLIGGLPQKIKGS